MHVVGTLNDGGSRRIQTAVRGEDSVIDTYIRLAGTCSRIHRNSTRACRAAAAEGDRVAGTGLQDAPVSGAGGPRPKSSASAQELQNKTSSSAVIPTSLPRQVPKDAGLLYERPLPDQRNIWTAAKASRSRGIVKDAGITTAPEPRKIRGPVSSSLPAQKERQGLFEPRLCFSKIGSAGQDKFKTLLTQVAFMRKNPLKPAQSGIILKNPS